MTDQPQSDPLLLTPRQRKFITGLTIWMLFTISLLTLVSVQKPASRAVICMVWGLVLLWIILFGALSLAIRHQARDVSSRIPLPWQFKFVVFCTLLACLEEAVTTGMTNLAPFFGVPMGVAYITASGNYWDVISQHSVIVFIPLFIGWAWMLTRWRFSPFAVYILFGITGMLAEVSFSGPQQLLGFGIWIPVYGLMAYLPACCVPNERSAKPPHWALYPFAVFIPFLFEVMMFPVVMLGLLDPKHHPKFHFPPLAP